MPITSDGVVSKETKEQWPSVPNPGSDEALESGCRCPVRSRNNTINLHPCEFVNVLG
jgi:hypothetical protein